MLFRSALADLVGAGAEAHDDVYVYLFARTGQRDRGSLILFNNSPRPREGVVTGFVAAAAAGGIPDLPAALGFGGVPDDRALSATAHSSNGRTAIAGGERVSWGAGDLRRSGLRVTLAPYEAVAYIDIAESFSERSIGPQQGEPVSTSTARSRRSTQPVSVIAGYGPRSAASRRAAARRRR